MTAKSKRHAPPSRALADPSPKEAVGTVTAPEPQSLATFTASFALYIDGTAMEPRYFDGEILWCNPKRPLSNGCFVAIDLGGGKGIVRQLVKRDGDHLVLHQFNPPQDSRLHVSKAKAIVRVVGAGHE